MQKVLSLANIDREFAERLLTDPSEALQAYGFQLPSADVAILCNCRAKSLTELSQQLREKLGISEPE